MAFSVAAIVIMASAAVSAYASYESGVQQEKAADFNAQMATYQADQAKQAAQAKAEIYERDVERRMGTMRQQYAASGVELSNAGTPLSVMMDSAVTAAKDVVRIKAGGDVSAWGFMSEAALSTSQGQSAMAGGQIAAGASLLGGAAKVFSMYQGAQMKMPTSVDYSNPGFGD